MFIPLGGEFLLNPTFRGLHQDFHDMASNARKARSTHRSFRKAHMNAGRMWCDRAFPFCTLGGQHTGDSFRVTSTAAWPKYIVDMLKIATAVLRNLY